MLAGSWICLGIALALAFLTGRFIVQPALRLGLMALALLLPWLLAVASLDLAAQGEAAGWANAIFMIISLVELGHAGLALLAYIGGRALAAEAA